MWGNGYTMMGSGWLVGVVVLALVVVAVIVVLRVVPGRGTTTSMPPIREGQQVPRQVLDERCARGDITTDEYLERVKNLGSV